MKYRVAAVPTTDPKIMAEFPDGLDFTFLVHCDSLMLVYREGTPAGELLERLNQVVAREEAA